MELKSASWIKTEVPFTLRLDNKKNELFVDGQIDLVYQYNKEIRVIDFKTDKYILSNEYDVQL